MFSLNYFEKGWFRERTPRPDANGRVRLGRGWIQDNLIKVYREYQEPETVRYIGIKTDVMKTVIKKWHDNLEKTWIRQQSDAKNLIIFRNSAFFYSTDLVLDHF